ncbi:MAG: hypothetical protein LUQ16_01985 [Methanomassiliicoccales archaeon]|nr:hypothetical protein [Methanomassiliicoccales archaeon]MDD1755690.1 hypothetical protein [Methanomassiliicoccales archaeon]
MKGFVLSVIVVFFLLATSVPISFNQDIEDFLGESISNQTIDQPVENETLWLDTYGPDIHVDYSQNKLNNSVTYIITIEGTWSAWPQNWWTEGVPPVGPVEDAPMYPSQGGGKVGADPYWGFAYPQGEDYARSIGAWPLPAKWLTIFITLDKEASWEEIRPINDVYNPLHKYEIEVVGKGEVIGFCFDDTKTVDNCGMLKIVIEPEPDTDGDSLYDSWEQDGIDFNGDDEVDLDLPDLGANWLHKDIFVEGDYMAGKAPNFEAIDDVKAAFSNAKVSNPDNVQGINLHVLIDESVPWSESIGFDGLYALKNTYFGTEEERQNINAIQAKKMTYRYCLFANKLSIDLKCPGIAEGFLCDDFILAFGAFSDGVGSRAYQEAVFMHELGHTLGLHHGGDVDANFKPNYPSIMNYAFEFNNLVPTRPLDYSCGNCIELNESRLDEYEGIGQARPTVWRGSNNVIYRDPSGLSIDWEYNGWIDNSSVSMNLNNWLDEGYPSPAGEKYYDFNDWANLVYNFRGTPLSAASATPDDYHIELTTDQIEQMEEEAVNIIEVDISNNEDSSNDLPTEVIFGIVAIPAIIIVVAVFFLMRRKKI